MKKILLIISILFLFSGKVYAECTGSEKIDLNQKAANIKVKYDIEKKEELHNDGYVINRKLIISIYNLSDEFYLIMKNKNTKEEKTFTSKDAIDGVISLETEDLTEVVNYVFEVKALIDVTSCPGQKFKTLYLTTPRTNEFYYREACVNNEDFDYCQEYVTAKKISDEEFKTKLNKHLEFEEKYGEKEQKDGKGILDYIVEYKWYIIITLLLIASGFTISLVMNKKKQRELGL